MLATHHALLHGAYEEDRQAAVAWEGRAMLAVTQGLDLFARQALERHSYHREQAELFGAEIADLELEMADYRALLAELASKG